jgi:ribosome-associated toxin RatA of RatAB toxin-antitoxin module
MREMQRSAIVPYTPDQMFDLIERVEDYPQFLPWCTATRLIERNEEIVAATVEVGFRELHLHVTTRNEKRRPEWMSIRMEGGSFRTFAGEWRLLALGDLGCRIEFALRYELALHAERIAGPLIDQAANRMVDAFVRRADAIYAAGQPSAP